ncbi:Lrp/AsnC family transcriptional regulator [Candidatus Micrarchaeota archaeon]|nr:Lrp/AsnC family transcriptional regulator [Candidatus Micrarchaeota archaeon]MBU1681778.1 Lrp/AsnC family transcriptional regulator [Candidatus Micrarchaeota archaeon]
MKIDEKDQKILSLLKKNSKMSNIDISKKLGITEGAVRSRIKKLLDNKTIRRFTIDTSSSSVLFAVLMAKAKTETKKMMEDIHNLAVHFDAYEISGEYDGCIILEAENMEEIDRKIDLIRKLKSVSETRTFISFGRW